MDNGEDHDLWGDDDDDDSLFAHIQESDYYNEFEVTTVVPEVVQDNPATALSNMTEILDPVTTHNQTTSELREELTTFQRQHRETVQLNTELKNKNYELQGEASTLRRLLEQNNATRQQLVFDKLQSDKEIKQKEIEVRRDMQQKVQMLESQLNVLRVDFHNLEEKNRQLAKRQSLGKSFSNPVLGTSPTGKTSISPPLSLSMAQSSQFSQSVLRNEKIIFPNRSSFFAKEVHSQLSVPAVQTDSKEIQTEEFQIPGPASQISSTSVEEEGAQNGRIFLCSVHLYGKIKETIRRLITVEIRMLKPVIEKTLRYAPSAFKRRIKHRKARFGLGFEAFDATGLMLQWMDHKEMEQFQEDDIQEEYFIRMREIYDHARKDTLQYPPPSEEIESHSENWPDSERITNSSGEDDVVLTLVEGDDPMMTTLTTQLSQLARSPDESTFRDHSPDSDTSEDEYELENPSLSMQTPASTDFDLTAGTQTQQSQKTQTTDRDRSSKNERKPLTFFKEYKLKSRLQADRNCYKYIKDGQPLEVVAEILDGLYENGPAIWTTLYFVKNELKFLLDEDGHLFESNRLQVFFTLLVWAKNLWSVISAVEEEEKPKLNHKEWEIELFGWTELIILVVWRPSRSLVEFCRELRSIFLQIILSIIESGYFESTKDNYRQLFLTIQDTIESPTHHSLLNTQLVVDILALLPRMHLVPFFCKRTILFDLHLPKCFLLELSNRIKDEFQLNPSLSLFDGYMDILHKAGNPQVEINPITRKINKKRKFVDELENQNEDCVRGTQYSLDSLNSLLYPSPPTIFKETEKCACRIAAITNFLLILSKTFRLYCDRFRCVEFELNSKKDAEEVDSMNIYTAILVRAFEFIYTLYRHSDNLTSSYGSDVSTYFWDIVASYKRFRNEFPLRPDMHMMLLHMTMDGEDKRKDGEGGITFSSSLEQDWIDLVTQCPNLNPDADRSVFIPSSSSSGTGSTLNGTG